MHGGDLLYQAFIYLAAAVVAVPIAKKLGFGSVLGYLLAGVIIGPGAQTRANAQPRTTIS